MAYSQNKTLAIDSILLTSCKKVNNFNVGNQQDGMDESDYWNIDDILGEEELIPCCFKGDAKHLAHLELMDQQVST